MSPSQLSPQEDKHLHNHNGLYAALMVYQLQLLFLEKHRYTLITITIYSGFGGHFFFFFKRLYLNVSIKTHIDSQMAKTYAQQVRHRDHNFMM